MNWADQNYAIGRGIAAIRHRAKCNLQPLLRAAIEFALPGLLRQATGSTFPNVSASQIANIPFPELPERDLNACARLFGALDDKIELNRKMSATLEAMARALFKSWFVDFDPVRAKAEGRDTGLASEIAALFPSSLIVSEPDEVPSGWHKGRAADLFSVQNGYAFRSRDWVEFGVPVIKIGSVKPGVVDLEAVSYVSYEIAEREKRFRLQVGDLLIGMTGYVGEVGLIPPTSNPPLLNQRVGKIVSKDANGSFSAFTYAFFRSPEVKAFITSRAHGSAQPNVSAEAILDISIIVPSRTVRDAYDNLCSPMMDKILNGYGEISTLAAVRDALLPKLISGELRVKDAERILEKSA